MNLRHIITQLRVYPTITRGKKLLVREKEEDRGVEYPNPFSVRFAFVKFDFSPLVLLGRRSYQTQKLCIEI
jgi:hypothetical protein